MDILDELKEEIVECKLIVEIVKEIFLFLLNSCSVDKYVIEGEELDVRKCFDSLFVEVLRLKDNLIVLKDVLEKYNKILIFVEELLECIEKVLVFCEFIGIIVEKGKD